MTQDEIIEMARQAGINYRELSDEFATGNGDGVEIEQMEAFVKIVATRTLSNIDPSSFMSWQEGYAAGRDAATKGFCAQLRQLHDSYSLASNPSKFRLKDKE